MYVFKFLFALIFINLFPKVFDPILKCYIASNGGYFTWSIFLNVFIKIKFTYHSFHPKCTVFFSICTELCNHHHNLTQNIFVTPKRDHIPISSDFSFPTTCTPVPAPRPRQPLIHFLSVQSCLFFIFHTNGIIYDVVFYDWLLLCNILLSQSILQHVVCPFYCQIIFHYMDISHFIYLLIKWTSELFPLPGCYE